MPSCPLPTNVFSRFCTSAKYVSELFGQGDTFFAIAAVSAGFADRALTTSTQSSACR